MEGSQQATPVFQVSHVELHQVLVSELSQVLHGMVATQEERGDVLLQHNNKILDFSPYNRPMFWVSGVLNNGVALLERNCIFLVPN